MWDFGRELIERRERLEREGYSAYCLYCKTGRETALANELNQAYACSLALPFLRTLHKSRDGNRFLEQEVLLKGYVFLYLPEDCDTAMIHCAQTGFRILEDVDGMRTLEGDNRRYAQWVLSMGGIVGVSKALRVGSRVRIVDGPLLHVEGCIVEYSKKNRNCRIRIDIGETELKAWLPFAWVEDADAVVGAYGEEG